MGPSPPLVAVQEAVAARAYYRCHRAMVVANQEFTQAARELARANQVELWGRSKLAKAVLSTQTPAKAPAAAAMPVAARRTPID